MALIDELAEKLADDTFKAMKHLDDDRFFMEVAAQIGASSTTLEEAYLTAVRVRLAERKARAYIKGRIDGSIKKPG